MSSLPLSMLQSLLHPEDYRSPEDYHNPEDLKKIAKLEAVVKSLRGKLEELVVERKSEKETKLQSKQEVERSQAPDECETKGIGPDNAKEIVQGSKPTSQESKRRRIRKSDK